MSQNAVFLNFEMLLRAADYIEKRGNVKQKDRGSPVAAIEYRVVVSPVLNSFCSALLKTRSICYVTWSTIAIAAYTC